MTKHWWLMGVLLAGACGSKKDANVERYAVGTNLFTGDVIVGSTHCKHDAAPGVLDGTMVIGPGEITETCESGVTMKIIAEYADHIAIVFPKTAKVGDKVFLKFELRNAKDQVLTPALSQMGTFKLADGCTALDEPVTGGAQDTGHDPFPSSTAKAAGTCTVQVDLELPVAGGGKKKHHAEQTVTVK